MNNKNVRQLKRAVIKEEYIAITGDMMEAIILNQMIYWSERVKDFDDFIKEEHQRELLENGKESDIPLLCGWIYKSAAELKTELMSMDSIKTIGRKLDDLVTRGFLSRRNNPKTLYDRKYQYRVNFMAIIDALGEYGYTLEGYKVELSSPVAKTGKEPPKKPGKAPKVHADASKGQIDECIGQNDEWKGHHDECIRHSDNCNRHGVQAIPETTSKTTPEITSDLSSSDDSALFTKSADGKNARMEDRTGKVSKLADAIGIGHLRHKEMAETIRTILSDLLATGKVGRNRFQKSDIEKCLSRLSADDVDAMIDRFAAQAKKSQIAEPEEYIKASLLKAGKVAEMRFLAGQEEKGQGSHDTPSYDIDEYVRLSMKTLHGENLGYESRSH